MTPKPGDVFEYVGGSLLIVGSGGIVYRLSFNYHFELTNTNSSWDLETAGYLFNLFEVLGGPLGGKYDKT